MTDRELTGDEAQRALREAVRRTRATREVAPHVPAETAREETLKDLADRFDMASKRMSAMTGNKLLDRERQGQCAAYFDCARSLREALASSAVQPEPETSLTVKELRDRANVCTQYAYVHRGDGQEMSAQFHLGAAMAFRDMADKINAMPASVQPETGHPWRTMASAPKDGTQVLVSGADWCAIGSWHEDRWWTHAGYHGMRPHRSDGRAEQPTHWTPLPLPSSEASAQETP